MRSETFALLLYAVPFIGAAIIIYDPALSLEQNIGAIIAVGVVLFCLGGSALLALRDRLGRRRP